MAERLFDDDPPPMPALLFRHAGVAELADDLAKKCRRGRQVIAVIVVDGVLAADFVA